MKLEDAVRALRDEGGVPGETPDETRTRVVAKLDRAKRTRARRPLWLVPFAAVLAAASASAAITVRLPAALQSISHALHLSPRLTSGSVHAPASFSVHAPVESPDRSKQSHVATPDAPPFSTPAPLSAPPDAPAPPRASPPTRAPAPAPPTSTTTSTTTSTSTSTATATATSTTTTTTTPDSLPLYRVAHRLHFVSQNPAAALPAWNAYLAADPTGAFALEARYNRAICLVRLGRASEARDALTPFAMGPYGGYRANEAKALLEALEGDQKDQRDQRE